MNNDFVFFRSDMKAVALVLAHSQQDDVNTPVSPRDSRTPLHLASSLGNLAMAQLLIWVSFLKNEHFLDIYNICIYSPMLMSKALIMRVELASHMREILDRRS